MRIPIRKSRLAKSKTMGGFSGRRTGNGRLAFCTEVADKHRGSPVFFSGLSRAQTFNTGSLGRSSAIVTKSDVPSICLMCVMEPLSEALNDRTTLKLDDTIWTRPSEDPRKRFEEPVQMEATSD